MGQNLSYNLYSKIFFCFWIFLSRSNKTGNTGQLWRMQSSSSGSIKRTRSIFLSGGAKMFDPPFYDIIFFLIPLFSQLFLLDPPPVSTSPPVS